MKIKKYNIFDTKTGEFSKGIKPLILKNKRVYPINQRLIDKYQYKKVLPPRFTYKEYGVIFDEPKIHLNNIDPMDIYQIKEMAVDTEGNLYYYDYYNQYFISKTWWTKFQLELMFDKHWMNDKKFVIPVVISIVALFIAIVSILF